MFFALQAELGERSAARLGDVRIVVVGRILLRFLERDDFETFFVEDLEQVRQDVRAERAKMQQHHVVDVAAENGA